MSVKDVKVHAGLDRADDAQVEHLVWLVAHQLPAGQVLRRIALILDGDPSRVAGTVEGGDAHI